MLLFADLLPWHIYCCLSCLIGGAAAGSADAVAGLVEDQPREERRNEVREVLLADPIWGTYPENLFLANLFVNPRLLRSCFR